MGLATLLSSTPGNEIFTLVLECCKYSTVSNHATCFMLKSNSNNKQTIERLKSSNKHNWRLRESWVGGELGQSKYFTPRPSTARYQ